MAESERRVWDERLLANPHAAADKRARVRRMFAAIAPRYDLNNRLHSLWMDQRWRREAVRLAQVASGDVVVDVACGTGDLLIRFAECASKGVRCIGIDFTLEMLELARGKRPAMSWINADATALPLADECADVVSIAFGIRNVQEPSRALREFRRILRPGGRVVILEFSLPANRLLRSIYGFYFRRILPHTATLISGDRSGAYSYLPQSVSTFVGREEMMAMMREAGFVRVSQHPLTMGICVCYRGIVPRPSGSS